MNNKIITIKQTQFPQFQNATNLEGKPDPKYGSTTRFANIVVPPTMVKSLEDAGINVRSWTKGEDEDAEVVYFVKAQASWRYKNGDLKDKKLWPSIKIYEGRNSKPIELDEESVKEIDERQRHVEEVSVILNPWNNPNGGISLYIQDMSVLMTSKRDPFGDLYGVNEDENGEDIPF